MPATLQNQLDALCATVTLPWMPLTLAAAGARPEVTAAGEARINLELGYPAAASAARLQALVEEARGEIPAPKLELTTRVVAHSVQGTLAPLPHVKNIIAVSSAKGGVGKSTVAVNLALALQHEGARVGILDADIYGPSQPMMLGVAGEQPVSKDGKTFEPVMGLGLQMNSIGCLVDTEQPMVWRGPMVTQALNQLLFQTNWRDLDYLVVDMPPGTGDIQLTLSQKVPVAGAVIVTTPQDIALADAVRGLRMFEKVRIPVLGLVENMSSFVCPGCGESTPLFGSGGGVAAAAANGMTVLGQLPLDLRIRQEIDSGSPTVASSPDSPLGLMFRDMALHTVARLAERPREYKGAFAGIKIEKA
ncbi:MAG: iron-sulfur cluster carrier protein ApbC [Gammaproteobacteria bacterium]|jgi:ATP-binding protein involved in chromosome partitioning|nr:iron-sulfur cluster carrier protein ApbC [Gammaproteobacteria bacterium]